MALAFVECEEDWRKRGQTLADQWKVPLVVTGDSSSPGTAVEISQLPNKGVKAVVGPMGLAIGFVEKGRGKPYWVDFMTSNWRLRFSTGLPKSHNFRRALGIKDKPGKFLDTTAGFGQDSVMALASGFEVTAVERSPIVTALLMDGIERAIREDGSLKPKFQKLRVHNADSAQYLKTLAADHRPDVIYIDPMFDKPKKTAKSPKEMQLLQELLGAPPSAEEEKQLFELALQNAKSRVVVKRPLKSRALKAPTHSVKGQSIRFDVYVVQV